MITKVLLCDDHTLFREGLRRILETRPGEFIIDEAGGRSELLEQMKNGSYQVILLDISMPAQNGLELLKVPRRRYAETPVLVLSRHLEPPDAVRALRAGAAGYLNEKTTPRELIQALRRLRDGHRYIPPAIAEQLAVLVSEPESDPVRNLSDREYQVLQGIASGKSLSQIAGELFLSHNTISTYRTRLLCKLNLDNNAQIIRYALKNNLVD